MRLLSYEWTVPWGWMSVSSLKKLKINREEPHLGEALSYALYYVLAALCQSGYIPTLASIWYSLCMGIPIMVK